MATVSVHFDGAIAIDHKLSLRVMARTYQHMQRALDRAYLILEHGEVWKHARLKDEEYEETEFIAEYPREGGVILDAIRAGGEAIVTRVYAAVRPVFEQAAQHGLNEAQTLAAQLAARRDYVDHMRRDTQTFASITEDPPDDWAERYSDRSVVKEVDQLIQQITLERYAGSTVEIALAGRDWFPPFAFDGAAAQRFHKAAAHRELGPPLRLPARIRSLDAGGKYARPKAKILNLVTGREAILHLANEADFLALHPHHTAEHVMLYVCPVLEAGGFDLHGGDLQFLAVSQDDG